MQISRALPAVIFFSIGMLFTLAPDARSQGLIRAKEDLKKAYDDVYKARNDLMLGNKTANPKSDADKKVAEAVAQYFIFRAPIKTDAAAAPAEFTKEIRNLMDKKNLKEKQNFIDMLGKESVAAMKIVLERDIKSDGSTVVYASQMLAPMAMLKQEEVCAYLIELIDDAKTHDVIRLHALKAMREVMPIRIQQELLPLGAEDFKDKDQNARRKFDAVNVDALVKYIERSIDTQKMQPDEIATMHFLRREAIISLAAAGAPAVTAQPKAPRKPLDGLVAPTLMKALTKRGLTPATNLHEKIEAAVGLCNMDYSWMPEYQSDVAVYLVGKTLAEFFGEYNKDLGSISVDGKNKQVPLYGFKADGKRFEAGLKKMEENARSDTKLSIPGNATTLKAAAELRVKANVVLGPMFLYKDSGRLEDFVRFVDQIRPKNSYPFKTLKTPEIPLD